MHKKLLAAVFASTLAVSALVGVAPASASAPVISTSSTIAFGQVDPVLVIDGTGFTRGTSTYSVGPSGDFTIDVGSTGLTAGVFGVSSTRVNVNFTGRASDGTITVTANATAHSGSSASNTLSITVSPPPVSAQPTLVSLGGAIVVGHATWATANLNEVEHWLRACKGDQPVRTTPLMNNDGEMAPQCVALRTSPGMNINEDVPAGTYDLRNMVLAGVGPTTTHFLTSAGSLNDFGYTHVYLRSTFNLGFKFWVVSTAALDFSGQQGGGGGGTGATPPPYTGPMITPPAGVIAASAGGQVTIPGSRLGGVSKVEIAGLDAQVVVKSDGSIEITVPRGLSAGVYDLVIVSDSGRLTVQGAIRITGAASGATASGVAGEARPSTRMIAENTVKVWVFDAVGAGKVQIMLNGREVAWVNAASSDDPKLRDGYLVRTLTLAAGKNVIEVYVDGERVSRRVATGS